MNEPKTHTNDPRGAQLVSLNSLFEPFWPDGMRDFRGVSWPNRWRGGLFQKLSDPTQWRALFGNAEDVLSVTKSLIERDIKVVIVPPHAEVLECDGDELNVRCAWFSVGFALPEGWAA